MTRSATGVTSTCSPSTTNIDSVGGVVVVDDEVVVAVNDDDDDDDDVAIVWI